MDGHTQVGTLDYMAPEILEPKASAYDEGVDVWALGVMVYEMLYGTPPFSDPDFERTCTNIIACDVQLTDDISEHAQDFLRKVLCKVRGRSACSHPSTLPQTQAHSAAAATRGRWRRAQRGLCSEGVVKCAGRCGSLRSTRGQLYNDGSGRRRRVQDLGSRPSISELMRHPFLTTDARARHLTEKKWRLSDGGQIDEETVLRIRMHADFLTQHVRCAILRHERRTVRVMTDCPITKQLLSAMLRQKKYTVTVSSSSLRNQDAPGPSRCDGLVAFSRTHDPSPAGVVGLDHSRRSHRLRTAHRVLPLTGWW